MKTLREMSETKAREMSSSEREKTWEMLTEMKDTVDAQRLVIIELEENVGAATQENEWLKEEIRELKAQVLELEELIYGEVQRFERMMNNKRSVHLFNLILFSYLTQIFTFIYYSKFFKNFLSCRVV